MIYVTIVFKSKLTGKWMTEDHEFEFPQVALRFMYAMRSKNQIIDGWRCDDPRDNEWLSRRFKL